MAIVKINLSGHQNQDLADMGFVFPGALHIDLQDDDVAQKVATFVAGLGIGSGDTVTIAAPGLAPLALMVAATIHGLTGTFPFLVMLARQSDGTFAVAQTLDLQELRNVTARGKERQNIIKL